MEFTLSQMVPAEDIPRSLDAILHKLDELSSLVVIDNNRPQFVMMTLSEYQRLTSICDTSTTKKNESTRYVPPNSGMKIGLLVQDSMRHLIYEHILPQSEIENLTNPDYCSQVFGISYPVLKQYDPSLPFDEQKRDANNYNRYYNFRLVVDQFHQYLLCSQWVEPIHRIRFEKWLKKWR